MKKTFKILLLLLTTSSYAVVDCTLPSTVGGVKYCPAVGYQTCSMDVPNVLGVLQPRYFCFSQPSVVEGSANAVFMFHGGGHTGNAVAKHWDNQKSEAFIVLPSAKLVNGKRSWNTVNSAVPNFNDLETVYGHSDTDFIAAVLVELDSKYSCGLAAPPSPCIKDYYAAGFSSGAGMVFQLLTRNFFSSWFKGYGAVSNYMNQAKKAPVSLTVGGLLTGNIDMPFVPIPIAFMMGTDERINLPLDYVESLVDGACPQPSTINLDLRCFRSMTEKTLFANRLSTAMWLRNRLGAVNASIAHFFNGLSDDTVVTTQLYVADPIIPDSVAVLVGTVVNGGHSWPSINNIKSEFTHSEDIETSDELVNFWITFAGW